MEIMKVRASKRRWLSGGPGPRGGHLAASHLATPHQGAPCIVVFSYGPRAPEVFGHWNPTVYIHAKSLRRRAGVPVLLYCLLLGFDRFPYTNVSIALARHRAWRCPGPLLHWHHRSCARVHAYTYVRGDAIAAGTIIVQIAKRPRTYVRHGPAATLPMATARELAAIVARARCRRRRRCVYPTRIRSHVVGLGSIHLIYTRGASWSVASAVHAWEKRNEFCVARHNAREVFPRFYFTKKKKYSRRSPRIPVSVSCLCVACCAWRAGGNGGMRMSPKLRNGPNT